MKQVNKKIPFLFLAIALAAPATLLAQDEKKDKKGNDITMQQQLDKGRCTFILHGKKLSGGYTLIKFGKGDDKNWMLKKVDDEHADGSDGDERFLGRHAFINQFLGDESEERRQAGHG